MLVRAGAGFASCLYSFIYYYTPYFVVCPGLLRTAGLEMETFNIKDIEGYQNTEKQTAK